MGEKRKPAFTFLLKERGKKTNKIELFFEQDYSDKLYDGKSLWNKTTKYRLRSNGKWYIGRGKYTFLTKWEIRDLLWRSIKFPDY